MILVTGGTGLVGSHLLFELTKNGTPVRATYRQLSTLKRVRKILSYYSNNNSAFETIEWVEADLNNLPKLSEAFEGITHVYHCAAYISFDPSDYRVLRNTNIRGTSNIVNLCIAHKIQKLCYVSSIAALGFDENSIDEETQWPGNKDQSEYAISKYGGELEVWRGTQEGVPAVIVNPGVIVGPGFWNSGSGLLFKLGHKGFPYFTNSTTGYVSVWDVVKASLELMNSHLSNERFILVGENRTNKDITAKIAVCLGAKPPHKSVSKIQLQWAWRFDWFMSKILKRKRRLSKSLSQTLSRHYCYSNTKVKRKLEGFEFESIDKAIELTSQLFLEEFSS